MINYLINNPYLIIIGLFAALIVSYKIVQKVNHLYEFDDVDIKKFKVLKAVLAVLPFLAYFVMIFFISVI